MKIEQLYTGCLSQGAYYIESNGEAAVIDPLREVGIYISMAAERGAKIKYIFETHFHADFVSGHLTLAQQTGAEIVFGPTANTDFNCIVAEDNQEFKVGNVTVKLLHTPGHTMESSSYLLLDENRKQIALFSGDTLFLGDVGRPDLAQKSTMTQEDLAEILFDSLRAKIMTLSDDVILYPGHGAGSACGKNMSKETVGSIGHEKATNYALREDMNKQEFVKEVTEGILPPPAYFPENVMLNKSGYNNIDELIKIGKYALSVSEVKSLMKNKRTIILDVRHENEFVKGYVPSSIFIGIDGGFAPWVGAIIEKTNTPIILVLQEGRLDEVITRLSRVGFDNVLGYLKGGVEEWTMSGENIETLNSISPSKFENLVKSNKGIDVIDVRKKSEYLSEHMEGAENIPLTTVGKDFNTHVNTNDNYIHCAGGYRSVIACSILKRKGIHNIVNIDGGFDAMRNLNINISEFICPSTL